MLDSSSECENEPRSQQAANSHSNMGHHLPRCWSMMASCRPRQSHQVAGKKLGSLPRTENPQHKAPSNKQQCKTYCLIWPLLFSAWHLCRASKQLSLESSRKRRSGFERKSSQTRPTSAQRLSWTLRCAFRRSLETP